MDPLSFEPPGKPIFMYEVKWSESRSVVSYSLWPHGLYSPWNSLGQNTGVGSLSLLQGIFPTHIYIYIYIYSSYNFYMVTKFRLFEYDKKLCICNCYMYICIHIYLYILFTKGSIKYISFYNLCFAEHNIVKYGRASGKLSLYFNWW